MRGTYRMAIGLFCEKDCLKIRSGPLTTSIAGQGSFTGMAILPLVLLIEFAETVSSDDQIKIEKLNSSITFGPLQFNCDWKEEDYVIPDWPYKATLAQIIGLKQRYEAEVLNYQKLTHTINQAEIKAKYILEQAVEILRPTGIEIDDLEDIFDDVVKRVSEEDEENIIW